MGLVPVVSESERELIRLLELGLVFKRRALVLVLVETAAIRVEEVRFTVRVVLVVRGGAATVLGGSEGCGGTRPGPSSSRRLPGTRCILC